MLRSLTVSGPFGIITIRCVRELTVLSIHFEEMDEPYMSFVLKSDLNSKIKYRSANLRSLYIFIGMECGRLDFSEIQTKQVLNMLNEWTQWLRSRGGHQ
jgi:hypothetical protein